MKNTSQPFFLFAFFALVFNFIAVNAEAQSAERIKLVFGTRSRPSADGEGCEGDKGTCIIIKFKDRIAINNYGVADVSVRGDIVNFNILEDDSPAEDHENIFYVHAPKEFPEEVCKELGYSRIVLEPGQYKLDKSRNPLGMVQIRASIE